jgi:nitrogen regulatory protein P-II 2
MLGIRQKFMKLMSIVVKPSKVEAVKSAISSVGVSGATILDARGFGSTKGHTDSYRGAQYQVDTNPKAMLQVACKDESVNDIVEAVRSVANTNTIGDGKIFITELLDVIRIRTGETGEGAINGEY